MADVLNQSLARHGAQTSYILVNAPANTTKHSQLIEAHFDSIGGPSACVILKYPVAWIASACRRRGAVVVGDSIDNHRAFSKATFANEHYAAMDAMIVQTEWHAAEIAAWGYTAIVLPHAHGNLGSWSMATTTRRRLRGVGFVMSDSKNMPTRDDMRSILRGCCHANTTLYVINSQSDGLRIHPYAHNCSDTEWFGENATATADALHRRSGGHRPSSALSRGGAEIGDIESLRLPTACSADGAFNEVSSRGASHGGDGGGSAAAAIIAAGVEDVQDSTRQRRYYESEALLKLIDVRVPRWRMAGMAAATVAVTVDATVVAMVAATVAHQRVHARHALLSAAASRLPHTERRRRLPPGGSTPLPLGSMLSAGASRLLSARSAGGPRVEAGSSAGRADRRHQPAAHAHALVVLPLDPRPRIPHVCLPRRGAARGLPSGAAQPHDRRAHRVCTPPDLVARDTHVPEADSRPWRARELAVVLGHPAARLPLHSRQEVREAVERPLTFAATRHETTREIG